MSELADVYTSDAVIALGELTRMIGAHRFEISYNNDDPAYFSFSARLGGRPITSNMYGEFVEESAGDPPEIAADMLAHKLLDGRPCPYCKKVASTRGVDREIYETAGRSKRARCVWWRDGDSWKRGCE